MSAGDGLPIEAVPTFATLWEFRVPPENVQTFRHAYGPDGAWARLFARSPGFLGVDLLEDRELPGRFVTIDRWTSHDAYLAARAALADDYAALDQDCAALTSHEAPLGSFSELA
jgi:quinol monooxygenase YgiN